MKVGMDREHRNRQQKLGKKESRERSDANLRTAREVDAHQMACH
jgi:hypothetical protein